MEAITTIISIFLFAGLILSPIFIIKRINKLKIKFKFIIYMTIGMVITFLITVVFAWWSYTSDKMLLAYYGYEMEGMNESEFYGGVSPENMERVKSLQMSIMGIGWPLKAIMTYIYYLPYLLIVYIITYIIQSNRKKNYT